MTTNIPEKQYHSRFFYGWVIVAAGFAVNFSEGALRGSVFSVLLGPMAQEFRSTRTALVGAVSLAAIVSAVIAPIIGPLIDKRGPKYVVLVAVFISGATVIGLAFIKQLWQYWILFTLARAMSGSALMMGISVAIANWFIRRRGRAVAISSVGSRVSVMIFVAMSQTLVSLYSWRAAWLAMGMIGLLISTPLCFLIKQRPEEIGLLPDGDSSPSYQKGATATHHPTRVPDVSWSLREAMHTRALWLLVVATSLGSLAAQSVNIVAFSSLTDRGISAPNAAAVVTVSVIIQGMSALPWGLVAERIHIRYAAALIFVSGAVGMLAIIEASSLLWAYAYAVFYGVSFGGSRILGHLLYADYFGRASLGTIRGFVQPFTLVTHVGGAVASQSSFRLKRELLIRIHDILGWVCCSCGSYFISDSTSKTPKCSVV
ncbi:MFS transporter [Dehalococcoidia bacterium]|nr:MFS transporter [Dehalococcoidia bacterium]